MIGAASAATSRALTLCGRRPGAALEGPIYPMPYEAIGRIPAGGEGHGGSLGSHARQARPDHGGRQQPVARLGHRQGLPRPGRRAWPSPIRATRSRSASSRWRRRSARCVLGHCDVSEPATIDAVFAAAQKAWGSLDFVVHAIAFSDKDELDGRYVDTTPDNFSKTLLISCYSFTAVAQRAEKMMPNGGSLLTLTYYGAEKWIPHYNVMGVAKAALEASVRYLAADLGTKNIRVNAISSGPIKTLAAAGVGDFRYILGWNEHNAPLRRNVSRSRRWAMPRSICLSDLSRGVTGEILHVDAGYNIVGMKHPDAPDIDITIRQGVGRRAAGRIHHAAAHPLFRPPRRDRLEPGAPAAGPARYPAQRARPRAGVALRRDPARSARAERPRRGRIRLRVEPARPRPRDHGTDARGARARARPLPHRRAADGNVVRPLGGLHLRRIAGARGRRRWPRASATSGASCCRAARATRSSWCGCAPGTRASSATPWCRRMAACAGR